MPRKPDSRKPDSSRVSSTHTGVGSSYDNPIDLTDEGDYRTSRGASRPRSLRPDQVSGSSHFQHPLDTPLGRAQEAAKITMQRGTELRTSSNPQSDYSPPIVSPIVEERINTQLGRMKQVIDSGDFQENRTAILQDIIVMKKQNPDAFKHFDGIVQNKFSLDESWTPIKNLVDTIRDTIIEDETTQET